MTESAELEEGPALAARRALSPAVERWLEPRLADVPPPLADAVRAVVGRVARAVEPDEIPDLLADAALLELDQVLGAPQSRAGALRLLAADASLTYAFEAAAELGDGAEALAIRLGLNGELGHRLATGRARPEQGEGAPSRDNEPGAS